MIFQSSVDLAGGSFTLEKLEELQKSLLEFEKANEYYEKELLIARKQKDRETEGIVLGYIGSVYSEASQYEKARKSYEASLAVSREMKNLDRQGEALALLGLSCARQNRLDKALDNFAKAVAV